MTTMSPSSFQCHRGEGCILHDHPELWEGQPEKALFSSSLAVSGFRPCRGVLLGAQIWFPGWSHSFSKASLNHVWIWGDLLWPLHQLMGPARAVRNSWEL